MNIEKEMIEKFIHAIHTASPSDRSGETIADLLLKDPSERLSYTPEDITRAVYKTRWAMDSDETTSMFSSLMPDFATNERIFSLLQERAEKEIMRHAFRMFYQQNNQFYFNNMLGEQPAIRNGVISGTATDTFHSGEEDGGKNEEVGKDLIHTLADFKDPEALGFPLTTALESVNIDDIRYSFSDPYLSKQGSRVHIVGKTTDYEQSHGDRLYRYVNLNTGILSNEFEYVSEVFFDKTGKEYFLGYQIEWPEFSDLHDLFKEWNEFPNEPRFDIFLIEGYCQAIDEYDEIEQYVCEEVLYMMKLRTLIKSNQFTPFEYSGSDLDSKEVVDTIYEDVFLGTHKNPEESEKLHLEDKEDVILEEISSLISAYIFQETDPFDGSKIKMVQRLAESVSAYRSENEKIIEQYCLNGEEQDEIILLMDFIFTNLHCSKEIVETNKIYLEDFSIAPDSSEETRDTTP